jgi:hypothetical protein
MAKIAQIIGRIEHEVTLSVLVLRIVAGSLVQDAKFIWGWSRAISGL